MVLQYQSSVFVTVSMSILVMHVIFTNITTMCVTFKKLICAVHLVVIVVPIQQGVSWVQHEYTLQYDFPFNYKKRVSETCCSVQCSLFFLAEVCFASVFVVKMLL